MNYKIESSSNPLAPTSVRGSTPGASRAPERTASASADSFRVTDHARLATRVVDTAREFPDIDEQRVSTIRKAIDSGSYVVNAAAVATRMLQQEWQLSTS